MANFHYQQYLSPPDKTVLNLLEDEYGISPGQACVFYSRDNYGYKVLGGGWITK